jgi:hypothetical protein
MQTRVREYLEYLWQEERNRDHDQELSIIETLPPELREQLYAEACKQFLNSTAFCFLNFNSEFLKSLAIVIHPPKLKSIEEVHYAAGELLYQENHAEEDPNLYYVISGCVLLV